MLDIKEFFINIISSVFASRTRRNNFMVAIYCFGGHDWHHAYGFPHHIPTPDPCHYLNEYWFF